MGSREPSSRSPYAISLGAAAAVAVVSAAAALSAADALQQDFSAYWVAGTARRLGLDPYLNHVNDPRAPELWDGVARFRHSRFLYPPLVADLCRLPALLPFRAAKAIFTGVAVAAWLGGAALLAAITGARRDVRRMLIAGGLCFPLYFHLERGQVDLLLLVLLLAAWRLRAHPAAAGASLALAALVKPPLLILVPVLFALDRRRWAAAALAWCVALVALTAIVSGPALLRTYVGEVMPRAARYGEGGTEADLLHESDRPPVGDEERQPVDGHSYLTSIWDAAPWEITASASLPRLLAPREPTYLTATLPALVAVAGLIAVARRAARRDGDAALLVYLASAVAAVVISPAGWIMGLVWGLPIVALALDRRAAGLLPRGWGLALAAAWVACAIPAPVPGWPALAGTALVVAACGAAVGAPERSA